MATSSFSFIGLAILAALLFHQLRSERLRYAFVGLVSVGFLAIQMPGWAAAAPLVGFLALGYVCYVLCLRVRPHAVFIAAIGALLVAFLYLKRYSVVSEIPPLPFAYTAVGMSYMLFRILQLLIDQRGGTIPEPVSAWRYLCFTIFWPTLLAGPIMRYQAFVAEMADTTRTLLREETLAALSRTATGLLKVSLIGTALFAAHTTLAGMLAEVNSLALTLPIFTSATAIYLYYLYANFSGYTDIVIGIAALAGIRLPENFNRPFRSTSFLDFWSRWHITLSEWLKIYVFYPLLKETTRRWPAPEAAWATTGFALFVTYFLVGMWHGTTFPFLVYGLMQASAALVNATWQAAMRKRLGKRSYNDLKARASYAYGCRGLTLAYIAVALVCVWGSEKDLATWAPLMIPACLILAAVFAAGAYAWDRATLIVGKLFGGGAGFFRTDLLLGAKCALAIVVLVLSEGDPVSVYQNF